MAYSEELSRRRFGGSATLLSRVCSCCDSKFTFCELPESLFGGEAGKIAFDSYQAGELFYYFGSDYRLGLISVNSGRDPLTGC